MKKITIFILFLFVFSLATPALAAREMPTVGDRIGIYYSGTQEFPANTPFHIRHGWTVDFGETHAIGVFDFVMEIDGASPGPGLRYMDPNGDPYQVVTRIYNFPQGMPPGTYTFTGYWYEPCQYDPNQTECPDPNAPVLTRTSEVTVTFTP